MMSTTRIENEFLLGSNVFLDGDKLDSPSIAQIISWAAERKTTRVEDMAYCLSGLFDINLPLLYGEGKTTFFRLQEELLKTSDDQSLFAWGIHLGNKPLQEICTKHG